MQGIEKDILSSETDKMKNNKFQKQSFKSSLNGNKYMFKSTIPEGELIQAPPYQSRIMHKKYTDVNANSKFYYPNEDGQNTNATRSQWTNRANRILLDSQSNFYNTTRLSNNNSMI